MSLLLLWEGRASQAELPPAPCPVCKGPHWKRECPPRFRFQGSDSQDNWDQRCLGVPTQAPNLLTPEEPQVLIPGGPISQFSFGHQGNFLLLKAPGLLLLIYYSNGAVWMSQTLLFQSSVKLQLGPCAVFHMSFSSCRSLSYPFWGGIY